MLWGLVMQFMAGYVFLHCWNNLFGELLRFADREFYSVKHHRKNSRVFALQFYYYVRAYLVGLVDMYLILTILSQVEFASS